MRVTDIREVSVPLHGSARNAIVDFSSHDVSLVALVTDVERQGHPVTGLAFNSIGRFAQGGILRERVLPRLLAEPDVLQGDMDQGLDPQRIRDVALRDEKPGGHGDRAAAVAAVELAVWDLNAKLADEPAHITIARSLGREPDDAGVPVYAAGGYYGAGPDPVDELADELRGYLDQGFDACKIKVGGGTLDEDRRRIDTALAVLGDATRLAIDANGRLDRDTALTYAAQLSDLGLRWFEEPVDPLDFALHAEVVEAFGGRVATGENLFSVADVTNLVRHAGLRPGVDVFQMDAGLSYGLLEYVAMLEVLQAHGYDRLQAHPHGGHLINLHLVQALGCGGCEAYPGVFQPVGGYPPECRIDDGRVRAPEAPGFGLEMKAELRPWIEEVAG